MVEACLLRGAQDEGDSAAEAAAGRPAVEVAAEERRSVWAEEEPTRSGQERERAEAPRTSDPLASGVEAVEAVERLTRMVPEGEEPQSEAPLPRAVPQGASAVGMHPSVG